MAKKKTSRLLSSLISALVIFALVLLFYGENIPNAVREFKASYIFSKALSATVTDGEIFLHVIDVGQGDAILVQSSDGCILIDTGTNDSENDLIAHLRACGVKVVDYLICSHAHSDHIGGADAVFDNFEVKTVLIPYIDESNPDIGSMLFSMADAKPRIIHPARGDTFSLGDITVTALTPIGNSDDYNDMSLVMKLSFGDTSFLFTGDISENVEHELLSTYPNGELDCDFLKIAHHGSNTSTCTEFINALTPTVASVSCGRNNDFGHPRHEVLKRLSDGGCESIYRTDEMGSVILRCDGDEITLAAMREADGDAGREYK